MKTNKLRETRTTTSRHRALNDACNASWPESTYLSNLSSYLPLEQKGPSFSFVVSTGSPWVLGFPPRITIKFSPLKKMLSQLCFATSSQHLFSQTCIIIAKSSLSCTANAGAKTVKCGLGSLANYVSEEGTARCNFTKTVEVGSAQISSRRSHSHRAFIKVMESACQLLTQQHRPCSLCVHLSLAEALLTSLLLCKIYLPEPAITCPTPLYIGLLCALHHWSTPCCSSQLLQPELAWCQEHAPCSTHLGGSRDRPRAILPECGGTNPIF